MPLTYCGIRVTDLDRSTRFYTGVLGLREIRRGTMEHGGRWVLLEDPETRQRLELNYYPADNPYHVPFTPGEGLDHLAFEVEDARAFVRKLAEDGYEVAAEPWEERDGAVTLGYVKGPDHEWLEIFSRK